MPRKLRVSLSGISCHIIARENTSHLSPSPFNAKLFLYLSRIQNNDK